MATVKELLRNPLFKNATPEAQSQVIKALGLTSQDVFAFQESDTYTPTDEESQGYVSSVSAIPAATTPQDSSMAGTFGRSLYQGVAEIPAYVGRLIEGDTQRVNRRDVPMFGGKDVEFDEDGNAIRTASVEEIRKEQQGSVKAAIGQALQAPKDWVEPATVSENMSTKGVMKGVLENAPRNIINVGMNLIPFAGSLVSNASMYQDTFLQSKKGILKAIESGKIPAMSEDDIDAYAAKQGLWEIGGEGAGDFVQAQIIKRFTRGMGFGKVASPSEFLKLFTKSSVSKVGMSALGSMPIEGASEVLTEYGQGKGDIAVGMDKEANLPGRMLYAGTVGAVSGGVTGLALGSLQTNGDSAVNQTLTQPVSMDNPADMEKLLDRRVKAASTIIALANDKIVADNKQELITNLSNNIATAIQNNSPLPLNESLFTGTLDFNLNVTDANASDIVVGTSNTPKGGFDVNLAITEAQAEDAKSKQQPVSAIPVEPMTSPNIEMQREQATGIPSLTGTQSVMQQQMEQEEQVASEEQQMIAEQQAQREEQAKQEALQIEAKDSITGMSVKQSDSTYRPIINKDGSVQIRIARNGGNVVSLTKRMTPVEAKDFMEARAEEAELNHVVEQKQKQSVATVQKTASVQKVAPVQAATPVQSIAPQTTPNETTVGTKPASTPKKAPTVTLPSTTATPTPKKKVAKLTPEEQTQSKTLKEGVTAIFRIKKNKLSGHLIAAFIVNPELKIAPEQLMRSLFFDKEGGIHPDYIKDIKGNDKTTAAPEYLKGAKGVLDQAVIDGILDFNADNQLELGEGITPEKLTEWFQNLETRNENVESKQKVAKAKTVAEETQEEQKNVSATGLMESEGSAVGQKRTQRKSVPKEVETKVTEIEQTLKKASIQINDETDSQLRTAEEELNDLVKLYDRDQFKTDVLEKALSKLRNLTAVRARAPHQRLYNKISNITKFFRNIKDAVKAVNDKKVKQQLNKDLTKILGSIQNATLARDTMKAELDTALNGVTDENARKEIYTEFQKRASDFSVEITSAVDKFMQDIGVKPKDFAVSVARAEQRQAELPVKLAKEKQQRELDNEAILDIVKELEDKTTTPRQRYELVQGLKETGTGFPTLDKLVTTFLFENKKTPKPSAFTTLASQIKASAVHKAPVQGETLKKFERTKDEREGTQVKVSAEEGAKRYYTETEGAESNKSVFNVQTKDGKVVSDAHNAFKQFIESKNNIGASRSIPKNIKGFVEQISKAFNLSDKLFITTTSDIKTSALSEISSGASEVKTSKENPVGIFVKAVDGVNLIVLNDTRISSDRHLLMTLSHEIGHAIIEQHFDNAPMDTQLAVLREFQAWVGKLDKTDARLEALDELYQNEGATWEKFLKEYRAHITKNKEGEYTGIKSTLFNEYLAEQVAKYIKERHSRPEGAVAKFFSSLADQLRKLYSIFQSQSIKNRLPVASVARWLDGMQESARVSRRLEESDYQQQVKSLKQKYIDKGLLSFKEPAIRSSSKQDNLYSAWASEINTLNIQTKFGKLPVEVNYSNYALKGAKEESFNLLLDGSNDYIESIEPKSDDPKSYTAESDQAQIPETHFGTGNWVHIRGDVRTNTDTNNKVLHINELQSDWDKQFVQSNKRTVTIEEYAKLNARQKELTAQLLKKREERINLRRSNITSDLKSITNEIETLETEREEIRSRLDANQNQIAPPPIEGKYWLKHALKQIIRYANEKGIKTITFPSTPEQVAQVENWGTLTKNLAVGTHTKYGIGALEGISKDNWSKIDPSDIRYFAHGQDMTSIIDRMIRRVPAELHMLAEQFGGQIVEVPVEGQSEPLFGLTLTPAMVADSKTYGPKYSQVEGVSVSKRQNLAAIDQLKGVLEKVSNVGKLIRKGVLLPGIQALEYREVYFAEQAKALAQGYSQAVADRIARDAASNTEDGVVARVLDENHLMDTEKAEIVNSQLVDEQGKPVYEIALEAHNALTNPERTDWLDVLFAGKLAKKDVQDYDTKAKLEQEVGRKISDAVYTAYKHSRVAINNIFKQSNLERFNKVLNDIVGTEFGDDVRSIVTKAMYRNMSRNKRINYIKMEMDRLGYTNEQIKDIVASLPQGLIKEARRALNFYVNGGIPGDFAQTRSSKAENPFVVRVKETFNDAKGVERSRDKIVKFFDTKAEADAYAKSLEDDKVLQDVMAFDKTPIASLKDASGKLQVSVTEETDAQLGSLYPRSEYVNRINESLIKNVTEELTNNASVTKEDAKRILRSVQAVQTKQFLARTNARFMRRKKHHILGYDYVNPLQNAYRDAEQTATFIARANYINRVVTFAGTQQGARNIEALKEIKNSFTKYSGISGTISHAATTSFMMYRIVTALAQGHQYFVFGVSEMVASGIPFKTAVRTMTEDYIRVLLERGNISTVDLAKHMRGDKTLGRFLRSFMPKQSLSYLLEAIGKKKIITLTKEEQQLLERRRRTGETLDNVTKELNSLELANREGVSTVAKDMLQGVIKTGMFLFNEMEVLNREASLVSSYKRFRANGDSIEVAEQKAVDFMLRVNGDFNKYNKTLLMRKYPVISPMFSLTTFAFHSLGLLGYRTKKAMSGNSNSQKAMLSFAALAFLLGGLKGEPLWDQMNRMFTMMFGKDHLLDLEKWAKEGADTAVEKWSADMVSRGILAATLGIDWTNNVSMRLPWADAALDAYSGKKQDIGQYGAGLSWAMGVYKAGKDVVSGDFQKAMEDINLGGISQFARGMRYKEEGYSKGQGPQFFGTEQRKLTEKQAKLYMMGLKPLELSRTQDVIQSEANVLDVYWKNKKRAAEKEFFKAIDKYVRNEKDIPEEILAKATKHIHDFNTDLLKRKSEEIFAVKPITTQAILQGAKIRFTPNKAKAFYERDYEKLIKDSDYTADSADITTD